jgi:transposase
MTAQAVLADRAFDADERFLTPLEKAGKKVVVPSPKSRKVQRDIDQELSRQHHRLENFLAKLKRFRALATRYGKTARNLLAAVYLVAATIWLN